MGNEREGFLTSVRWHLVGTHRGAGIYGADGRQITKWHHPARIMTSEITEEGCCSTSSRSCSSRL
jgi:hypothetical protein